MLANSAFVQAGAYDALTFTPFNTGTTNQYAKSCLVGDGPANIVQERACCILTDNPRNHHLTSGHQLESTISRPDSLQQQLKGFASSHPDAHVPHDVLLPLLIEDLSDASARAARRCQGNRLASCVLPPLVDTQHDDSSHMQHLVFSACGQIGQVLSLSVADVTQSDPAASTQDTRAEGACAARLDLGREILQLDVQLPNTAVASATTTVLPTNDISTKSASCVVWVLARSASRVDVICCIGTCQSQCTHENFITNDLHVRTAGNNAGNQISTSSPNNTHKQRNRGWRLEWRASMHLPCTAVSCCVHPLLPEFAVLLSDGQVVLCSFAAAAGVTAGQLRAALPLRGQPLLSSSQLLELKTSCGLAAEDNMIDTQHMSCCCVWGYHPRSLILGMQSRLWQLDIRLSPSGMPQALHRLLHTLKGHLAADVFINLATSPRSSSVAAMLYHPPRSTVVSHCRQLYQSNDGSADVVAQAVLRDVQAWQPYIMALTSSHAVLFDLRRPGGWVIAAPHGAVQEPPTWLHINPIIEVSTTMDPTVTNLHKDRAKQAGHADPGHDVKTVLGSPDQQRQRPVAGNTQDDMTDDKTLEHGHHLMATQASQVAMMEIDNTEYVQPRQDDAVAPSTDTHHIMKPHVSACVTWGCPNGQVHTWRLKITNSDSQLIPVNLGGDHQLLLLPNRSQAPAGGVQDGCQPPIAVNNTGAAGSSQQHAGLQEDDDDVHPAHVAGNNGGMSMMQQLLHGVPGWAPACCDEVVSLGRVQVVCQKGDLARTISSPEVVHGRALHHSTPPGWCPAVMRCEEAWWGGQGDTDTRRMELTAAHVKAAQAAPDLQGVCVVPIWLWMFKQHQQLHNHQDQHLLSNNQSQQQQRQDPNTSQQDTSLNLTARPETQEPRIQQHTDGVRNLNLHPDHDSLPVAMLVRSNMDGDIHLQPVSFHKQASYATAHDARLSLPTTATKHQNQQHQVILHNTQTNGLPHYSQGPHAVVAPKDELALVAAASPKLDDLGSVEHQCTAAHEQALQQLLSSRYVSKRQVARLFLGNQVQRLKYNVKIPSLHAYLTRCLKGHRLASAHLARAAAFTWHLSGYPLRYHLFSPVDVLITTAVAHVMQLQPGVPLHMQAPVSQHMPDENEDTALGRKPQHTQSIQDREQEGAVQQVALPAEQAALLPHLLIRQSCSLTAGEMLARLEAAAAYANRCGSAKEDALDASSKRQRRNNSGDFNRVGVSGSELSSPSKRRTIRSSSLQADDMARDKEQAQQQDDNCDQTTVVASKAALSALVTGAVDPELDVATSRTSGSHINAMLNATVDRSVGVLHGQQQAEMQSLLMGLNRHASPRKTPKRRLKDDSNAACQQAQQEGGKGNGFEAPAKDGDSNLDGTGQGVDNNQAHRACKSHLRSLLQYLHDAEDRMQKIVDDSNQLSSGNNRRRSVIPRGVESLPSNTEAPLVRTCSMLIRSPPNMSSGAPGPDRQMFTRTASSLIRSAQMISELAAHSTIVFPQSLLNPRTSKVVLHADKTVPPPTSMQQRAMQVKDRANGDPWVISLSAPGMDCYKGLMAAWPEQPISDHATDDLINALVSTKTDASLPSSQHNGNPVSRNMQIVPTTQSIGAPENVVIGQQDQAFFATNDEAKGKMAALRPVSTAPRAVDGPSPHGDTSQHKSHADAASKQPQSPRPVPNHRISTRSTIKEDEQEHIAAPGANRAAPASRAPAGVGGMHASQDVFQFSSQQTVQQDIDPSNFFARAYQERQQGVAGATAADGRVSSGVLESGAAGTAAAAAAAAKPVDPARLQQLRELLKLRQLEKKRRAMQGEGF